MVIGISTMPEDSRRIQPELRAVRSVEHVWLNGAEITIRPKKTGGGFNFSIVSPGDDPINGTTFSDGSCRFHWSQKTDVIPEMVPPFRDFVYKTEMESRRSGMDGSICSCIEFRSRGSQFVVNRRIEDMPDDEIRVKGHVNYASNVKIRTLLSSFKFRFLNWKKPQVELRSSVRCPFSVSQLYAETTPYPMDATACRMALEEIFWRYRTH
jgi:hypothetical protein